MVAEDTIYGSETYRPYLDIERIINVQSVCSVIREHNPNIDCNIYRFSNAIVIL